MRRSAAIPPIGRAAVYQEARRRRDRDGHPALYDPRGVRSLATLARRRLRGVDYFEERPPDRTRAPALLIIDSLAAANGIDPNDRATYQGFFTFLRALIADIDTAIVLIAHTPNSVARRSLDSATTAWQVYIANRVTGPSDSRDRRGLGDSARVAVAARRADRRIPRTGHRVGIEARQSELRDRRPSRRARLRAALGDRRAVATRTLESPRRVVPLRKRRGVGEALPTRAKSAKTDGTLSGDATR